MCSDDESMSSDDSSDINSDNSMDWSDLFVADDTDTGNILTPKSKHNILLDRERGIIDTHWVFNSLMSIMFKPATFCISRLQTTQQPIQHQANRQIVSMIKDIKGTIFHKMMAHQNMI